MEWKLSPRCTISRRLLHDNFGKIDADFPSGAHYESRFDLHTLRVALNRQLGQSEQATTKPVARREPWPVLGID